LNIQICYYYNIKNKISIYNASIEIEKWYNIDYNKNKTEVESKQVAEKKI